MYEYAFIRCPVRRPSSGGVETEGYRRVVEEHADRGWRLVQVLIQIPAAVPAEYELIFERPRPA